MDVKTMATFKERWLGIKTVMSQHRHAEEWDRYQAAQKRLYALDAEIMKALQDGGMGQNEAECAITMMENSVIMSVVIDYINTWSEDKGEQQ